MTPSRQFLGLCQAPVLTVDGIGPETSVIKALAHELAPFPPATNNYPGLRRVLGPGDAAAWDYVTGLLRDAAPFIGGAFDIDGFDLVEASFSLVTTRPEKLEPVQRIPHFDAVDEDLFALLHYISPCQGTAFYRHNPSGTELVTSDVLDSFVAQVRRDAAASAPRYMSGSSLAFEQIGRVEGLPGRLVGYPARLLHSGLIPDDCNFSGLPAEGRLTTNIFVRAFNKGASQDSTRRETK